MNGPDHDVSARLRALPELPPTPESLPRLLRKRSSLQRRQIVLTTSLALALALPLLWLRERGEAVPIAVDAGPSPISQPAASADPVADLRVIDRALQAAYETHASDDEIAHLWAARQALAMHQ